MALTPALAELGSRLAAAVEAAESGGSASEDDGTLPAMLEVRTTDWLVCHVCVCMCVCCVCGGAGRGRVHVRMHETLVLVCGGALQGDATKKGLCKLPHSPL